MKQNIDIFYRFLKFREVNIKKILNNKNNFFQNENYFISVIVETNGDKKIFLKSLSYLKHSIAQSRLKIGITVVECNNLPTLRLFAIENGATYLFLKKDNYDLTGDFSSGLSYNVGALANSSSEYFIFHNLYALTPHDLFYKLERYYFSKNLNWFENYSNKQLYSLSKDCLKQIYNNKKIFDLNQFKNLEKINSNSNISLTVKKSTFFEIGGYDYELDLKRPLENMLLKVKLLCLEKEVNNTLDINFSDNVIQTNLLSLFLLNTNFKEKRTIVTQNMYDLFCNISYEEKLSYIKAKGLS